MKITIIIDDERKNETHKLIFNQSRIDQAEEFFSSMGIYEIPLFEMIKILMVNNSQAYWNAYTKE